MRLPSKRWIIGVLLILAVLTGTVWRWSSLRRASTWQRLASPGELSLAHAALKENCAACHTPVKGVEAVNCAVCHANNEALLQRQPTAFHAHIQSCSQCHIEHEGVNRRPTKMDHLALARFGLRELDEGAADSERRQVSGQLLGWIKQHGAREGAETSHPLITPEEMILDCASCHSNQDKHFKLFGQDCAQCHATAQWTIPAFQHPSPRSTNCAQCHQAPPSHYMEHFEMVDKTVAGKANAPGNPCCADVQVNQCYRCHQTNAWNDIKGVGWYKHH